MSRKGAVAPEGEQYRSLLTALDALDVRLLVVDTRLDMGLLKAARAHPDWIVDSEDAESALFTHAQRLEPIGPRQYS
jgi:hypothetical protein